jgi:nitrogen fixation protein FixH
MAAITISFFGVVIAVNLVMATLASTTFSGTVVDNGYVASQHFNHWLNEARSERAMGWAVTADRQQDHAVIFLTGVGGADVTAIALHPLGRLPDMDLHFREVTPGHYLSAEALPAGRWRLKIDVRQGARRARFVDEVPA